MQRIRNRVVACFIASVTSGLTLSAHDFWIEPSVFEPAIDTVVRVFLRVGTGFIGDPVRRSSDAIDAFFVAGPDGRSDVMGREGMDPAGFFRLSANGTTVVAYRSRPSSVSLDAGAFEKYLKEEGLERIIDARAKSGTTASRGVEIFSRSAKALLRAGGDLSGHDRTVGLTLELLPERHPSALPADGRMPVQLLYRGVPLEGALVSALSQDGRPPRQARTDRHGRVTLPLDTGVWLIKAVHMVPAPAGSGADWESIWASLTFKASRPDRQATPTTK
jgi:hypothetical protein